MKSIILIGYMGCGKTSVGVKLSYKLKRILLDTDKEIERIRKMTISEIFATQGEQAFRDMETDYLKELSHKKNAYVISTGGGLPLREENRKILKKCGVVVYLRTAPDTIYERLQGDTTRPLLQCENPRARIEEMIQARNTAYEECADLIIDTDHFELAELSDEIAKQYKTYLKKKSVS